jgi:DNA processing protein
MYPAENTALAEDIAKQGLRLSEQPMGLQPTVRYFPKRNRIILGLARATVVVEAAAKSGSLITARDALDQGRDVLAVPGHPFDARASGGNMLIRDGATLARNAADILDAFGPMQDDAPRIPHKPQSLTKAKPRRSLREAASLHLNILQRLGPSPAAEDQLIRDLQLPSSMLTPALIELEMDGKVKRSAGGLLSRPV